MTTTRHGSATIDLSTDREVMIQRAFEAPMSLVFDALTKPEHVRVWFSADGVPLHACEIDLRVGGKYHFAWYAKDLERSFRGTFMEIEPPTRIVRTCSRGGRRPAPSRRSASARSAVLRR
jgi:uncharacterized protein YndB with AHSA1/START domain